MPSVYLNLEKIYSGSIAYRWYKDQTIKASYMFIEDPIKHDTSYRRFVNDVDGSNIGVSFSGLLELNKKYSVTTRYKFDINESDGLQHSKAEASLSIGSEFHLIGDCDIRIDVGSKYYIGKKELLFNRYTGIYGYTQNELDNFYSTSFKVDFIIKSAILSFEMKNPFRSTYQFVRGYEGDYSGAVFTLDWTFND